MKNQEYNINKNKSNLDSTKKKKKKNILNL